MAGPRSTTQRRGWAFAACVAIVKPPSLAFTKRRWIDGHKLPADGGCIVVANHISHLDPFTLAHFLYDHGRFPRFLAKAEVFEVPIGGTIARKAGQIPVYRLSTDASRAFGAAVSAVQAGECVVVYPEGTISRDPGLWPMTGKTGAARIALAADVPVIPVAQWGVQDILPPYARTPKLLPRKTVTVTAGDAVQLDDVRGERVTSATLWQATDRIMDALTSLLGGIREGQPPPTRFDPRSAGVRQIGDPGQEQGP